jgi:hypothetical protein
MMKQFNSRDQIISAIRRSSKELLQQQATTDIPQGREGLQVLMDCVDDEKMKVKFNPGKLNGWLCVNREMAMYMRRAPSKSPLILTWSNRSFHGGCCHQAVVDIQAVVCDGTLLVMEANGGAVVPKLPRQSTVPKPLYYTRNMELLSCNAPQQVKIVRDYANNNLQKTIDFCSLTSLKTKYQSYMDRP